MAPAAIKKVIPPSMGIHGGGQQGGVPPPGPPPGGGGGPPCAFSSILITIPNRKIM